MKDDRIYLGHILEAIQDIRQYASVGLTHDYFGVDLALVWISVERDLPNLTAAVERLLVDLDAPLSHGAIIRQSHETLSTPGCAMTPGWLSAVVKCCQV